MVRAIFKVEERYRWIGLPAIGRASHSHFSTVDAVAPGKEHDDIAIEEIATTVEGQGGIRSKIDTTLRFWRRQREIYSAPAGSAIGREITTHRQPEDFVGTGG